jgi:hypothetical protein
MMHTCKAWDITLNVETLQEANKIACWLWEVLKDDSPMMAPHDLLNWDSQPAVLLEYVNSQALRDLTKTEVIDWVYLVSPGMAVASASPTLVGVEPLDILVDRIKDYNSKFNKLKASQGGFYVERVVLSKALMQIPSILSKMKGQQNKVYWERNEARDPKRYVKEAKTSDPQNSQEVVVTLNNSTTPRT